MWGLAELLWQQKVGFRARAHKREEEREAQRKASAYRKSRAELIRRQQE